MKLVRYGASGAERPGMVDRGGQLRDLSPICADIDLGTDPGLIERLSGLSVEALELVTEPVRFGPPVARTTKLIGIGLNYRNHAIEANLPVPSEPMIFLKAPSCISGANDPIVLPPGSRKTDWEVELGIVIGKCASNLAPSRVIEHIAGYLVVNDVSEREFQNERGGTWDKGKGCDSFGPLGPWLVTTDEVPDCQDLDLWLDVNGVAMQRGNTGDMIFGCEEIVSYVSRFMTLLPGDIITTGTPAGVGLGREPQLYLSPGDVVRLGVSGLGVQCQSVVGGEGRLGRLNTD